MPVQSKHAFKIELGPDAWLEEYKLPREMRDLLDQSVVDARASGRLGQRHLKIMGKTVLFPRLTGLFAANSALKEGAVEYNYSGGKDAAARESKAMRAVRRFVATTLGAPLNAALVNDYDRGDKSSIGRHSDDEGDLARDSAGGTLVAGVNWMKDAPDAGSGSVWTMRFRRKPVPGEKGIGKIVLDYDLKPGTVFVMRGPNFQRHFTHEIPKGTKGKPHPGERVSFTYRHMIPVARCAPVKRKAVDVSGGGE